MRGRRALLRRKLECKQGVVREKRTERNCGEKELVARSSRQKVQQIAFPHGPTVLKVSFMKVMTTQRCGGAGFGIRIKKKARCFIFDCGGSNAVSIFDGSHRQSPMATSPANISSTSTTMSTTTATGRVENKTASSATAGPSSSFSLSSYFTDTYAANADADADTSMAALLQQQLSGLERSVRSMHRRTVREGGGSGSGRVQESVAVVKESADPLSDFRWSMLQMIVEKEIVGGAELRELLHRFLSLNSAHHHHVILRAFAEI
ncbi:hypothetical protein GUJ93_ZPchr0010g8476 [Zizania palustris]|uniref:Transcription repressor n=1 Tax=Zizania palustris TaxID=103762 RepID=A0A8J5TBS3_ZIZPA|nr:hypothetical protein GUJ93_ZPchr0010g8476 [Zizania palustris]